MKRNFLVVDPEEGLETLRGLASPVRVRMLKLLHTRGPLNVNEISAALALPQSTVSANVLILEQGEVTQELVGDDLNLQTVTESHAK